MTWKDRKAFMDGLDPDNLKGGKTPKDIADGHFRWYLLQLLADIADSFGSMEYKYGEMLKIQQAKSGGPPLTGIRRPRADDAAAVPPTEKSRYGGPQ